jgi:hypothetical protein
VNFFPPQKTPPCMWPYLLSSPAQMPIDMRFLAFHPAKYIVAMLLSPSVPSHQFQPTFLASKLAFAASIWPISSA